MNREAFYQFVLEAEAAFDAGADSVDPWAANPGLGGRDERGGDMMLSAPAAWRPAIEAGTFHPAVFNTWLHTSLSTGAAT